MIWQLIFVVEIPSHLTQLLLIVWNTISTHAHNANISTSSNIRVDYY